MSDRAPSPLDRALLAVVSGPAGQLLGTVLELSALAAAGVRERLARASRSRRR
ncbi:hypothetical protein [Patulibacter defluvii]|uniref:hypothetical protein n=1 Tax=Patulibacter defluvii TaxID=3095358 RepID=UPI002A754CB5|nr:hypothetical protein [Patulibacter sp. DM4]